MQMGVKHRNGFHINWWESVDSLHLVQDKCKLMNCCKNNNETSGSLKRPEILSCLRISYLLRKGFLPQI
jgi:hypothetical protein